jgi:hypothetical protein
MLLVNSFSGLSGRRFPGGAANSGVIIPMMTMVI